MKRYKVVQDARGHWGIWDTEADDFASWGDDFLKESGAWALDDIVYYAGLLNTDNDDRESFEWDGVYIPRTDA